MRRVHIRLFGAGWEPPGDDPAAADAKKPQTAPRPCLARRPALCGLVTTPLPDPAPANWVDRHAPLSWRLWLKLGRFDRPTGIWLLMLPGWQGIALAAAARGEWPSLRLLALFAAG